MYFCACIEDYYMGCAWLQCLFIVCYFSILGEAEILIWPWVQLWLWFPFVILFRVHRRHVVDLAYVGRRINPSNPRHVLRAEPILAFFSNVWSMLVIGKRRNVDYISRWWIRNYEWLLMWVHPSIVCCWHFGKNVYEVCSDILKFALGTWVSQCICSWLQK